MTTALDVVKNHFGLIASSRDACGMDFNQAIYK